MPFVALSSHCEICGTSWNLELHHIERCRMGGCRRLEIEAPSNRAILCRSIHTQITEHRWRLESTARELVEAALLRLDLLILDEVGFVPFSRTDAELLFGVLTERYERGSVLVTTNLDFAR